MTLDELKKLEAEATPAPWHIGHVREDNDAADIESPGGSEVAHVGWRPDQALITALRNAAPKLIAVVEAAKVMRIYCLGSDCSTQNMLRRFDEALAALESP